MKTRLDHDELFPDRFPNSFKNRVNETIAFLRYESPYGKLIADCGEDNPMKRAIEKDLDLRIDSLDWDFNCPAPETGKYDVVLCFEVLEHLYNPLLFLNELKGKLLPGGIIYLSTPYQRPQILKAIHHYHEIPDDRIMWLFDEAGLRVEKMERVTIAGNWYDHILGIRPVLRYFQHTRMYKLAVNQNDNG
jgi:SAM-dependent methyltransferase